MDTTGTKRTRHPGSSAAFAVGLTLTVMFVMGMLFGDGMTPAGVILLLVGVVLLCTGLIQESIERSRRN
jgi:membrane-bound ClpP family serine protease